MVLGGTGTLMGMWWGAVLLVYLPQWSTSLSGDFNLGSGASAYLATIIFGVVLIVVMIAAPTGHPGRPTVGVATGLEPRVRTGQRHPDGVTAPGLRRAALLDQVRQRWS